MEEELVSVDLIIDWLQKQVKERIPIPPHIWLDAVQKMNVLLGEEQAKLFDYQQEVAKLKNLLLDDPETSVAKAKIRVEATEEYKKSKMQEAKISRVIEMIRIGKLQARMSNEEIKNY